jgi:hypothetical protein
LRPYDIYLLSQVDPCGIYGGQSSTGAGFSSSSSVFPASIIPPLLHIQLSPPHEVCDSSDQAAHYHHLSPKLGASFLTRHFGWKQNKKESKSNDIRISSVSAKNDADVNKEGANHLPPTTQLQIHPCACVNLVLIHKNSTIINNAFFVVYWPWDSTDRYITFAVLIFINLLIPTMI